MDPPDHCRFFRPQPQEFLGLLLERRAKHEIHVHERSFQDVARKLQRVGRGVEAQSLAEERPMARVIGRAWGGEMRGDRGHGRLRPSLQQGQPGRQDRVTHDRAPVLRGELALDDPERAESGRHLGGFARREQPAVAHHPRKRISKGGGMARKVAQRTERTLVGSLHPEPQAQPWPAQPFGRSREEGVVHAIRQSHRRVGQGLQGADPGQLLQPQPMGSVPKCPDQAGHHPAADIRIKGSHRHANLSGRAIAGHPSALRMPMRDPSCPVK